MKKTIRFWSSHFCNEPSFWMARLGLDSERYELVFDPESPDYVIGTEQIYTEGFYRRGFVNRYRDDRLLIFFASECITPDMNLFDYAMAYDRNFQLQDRVVRRPMASIFAGFTRWDARSGCRDAAAELTAKRRFCNFIYANPAAHPRRDQLFHELSSYKRVDALGRHLKNVECEDSRGAVDFETRLVELKRPYKFSIACENAPFPGYVSEKLMTSLMAHTVPIYWGDPTVAEDFNAKAFVNANGMTRDELLETVKKIDEDDALWSSIVSEPPMTESQYVAWQRDERAYRDFMDRIFSLPVKDAKRVFPGFWPDNYRRQVLRAPAVHFSWKLRVLDRLGRGTRIGKKIWGRFG